MATSIQTSNKPTILITGANGLLGQKLISQLMERGKFEVIGTGRGACRLERAGFTYWSIDLTQPEEVSRVIAELAPDTISTPLL
jgi:dTDP-4-dehydrorhamnose reductase